VDGLDNDCDGEADSDDLDCIPGAALCAYHPVADNWINQCSNGGFNQFNGVPDSVPQGVFAYQRTAYELRLRQCTGRAFRILLRFDLSDAAFTAEQVEEAILMLDHISGEFSDTTNHTVHLFALNRAWSEASSSWWYADYEAADCTEAGQWTTTEAVGPCNPFEMNTGGQFLGGGGDVLDFPYSSATVQSGGQLGPDETDLIMDATDLVKDWLSGAVDNLGLLIRFEDETGEDIPHKYASREFAESEEYQGCFMPTLEVEIRTELKTADPDASDITAVPDILAANGTAKGTIIVTPKDAAGNPLGAGQIVRMATTGGKLLDRVRDEGNGHYSQRLQAPGEVGQAVVTATVNEVMLHDEALVDFLSLEDIVDSDATTISVQPETVSADGYSNGTVTVTPRDRYGNVIGSGMDVEIYTTLGTLLSTEVRDVGDGTYTRILQAPEEPGTATVSATVNGTAIDSTATVEFLEQNLGNEEEGDEADNDWCFITAVHRSP
jgi:hypothetical protein